jgi:hypothetical protein
MRATPVITGVVFLALTLAACNDDKVVPAQGQQPPASTPATAPSSPTPSTPPGSPSTPPPSTGVPQGAVRVPDGQVDMSGLPEYYRERKVWVLNDGRTLQVTAMARDACAGVTGRVVEQNDQVVRILIAPMDMPQGGGVDAPPMCAQVLTPKIITVDLKAPLGNRKVIVSEQLG